MTKLAGCYLTETTHAIIQVHFFTHISTLFLSDYTDDI